jgi:hypothetical protein
MHDVNLMEALSKSECENKCALFSFFDKNLFCFRFRKRFLKITSVKPMWIASAFKQESDTSGAI